MQEAFPARTGSDLRELRQHLGVEQATIATLLRVTPTTVYRWERAATVTPLQFARYEAACKAILARASDTEAIA
jgi:DNA-binding transcriptional regulator YiaG